MNDTQRLDRVRRALSLADAPDDRLSWLRCLLSELVRTDWVDGQEDEQAAWECLRECQLLLDGLEDAFADEQAARLEAERVAFARAPALCEEVPF